MNFITSPGEINVSVLLESSLNARHRVAACLFIHILIFIYLFMYLKQQLLIILDVCSRGAALNTTSHFTFQSNCRLCFTHQCIWKIIKYSL